MGCDIHLYVEVRKDGKWASADRWTRDPYAPKGVEQMTVDYDDNWFTDRNYELFAVLAGVRGDARPICEPKGLPEDASALLVAEYENDGGHTPSWLTLQELMAADWDELITYDGCVSFPEYARWNNWDRKYGESPRGWCGGTSARTITEPEAKALIAQHTDRGAEIYKANEWGVGSLYVRASWSVPRHKVCERFLARVVARLFKLGKPEDVRIVFWFDN